MSGGWLDQTAERELSALPAGARVMLFGAGQGSLEWLQLQTARRPDVVALAILDNNATLHDKTLEGLSIHSPSALGELARDGLDRVIVTTVSGRDAVTAQLESLGLRRGEDFVTVGAYPATGYENCRLLVEALRGRSLAGMRALHVGCGGYLGLEAALWSLGASPVAMDAFSFGLRLPDVTGDLHRYRQLGQEMAALLDSPDKADREGGAFLHRYQSLFRQEQGRTLLDTTRLPYWHPHFFSAMPFPDASFDLVCSFAVLEHVRSPAKALAESRRVLAPGGLAVHGIVTCDHRAYGRVTGKEGRFTPRSHLRHDAAAWQAMTADTFHQNQTLPFQWRDLAAEAGLTVRELRILSRCPVTPEEQAGFAPPWRDMNPALLEEMDCLLVAQA